MNTVLYIKNDDLLSDLVFDILIIDGRQVYADSAIVTIGDYTPDNSVVIDSGTGIPSLIFTTNDTSNLAGNIPAANLRVKIIYTEGPDTIERIFYVDIAIANITSDVNDSMIVRLWPVLSDRRSAIKGQIGAGSTNLLIFDPENLYNFNANELKNSIFEARAGGRTLIGQKRLITMSDRETASFSLEFALPAAPSENDPYTIHLSYEPFIIEAWTEIQATIRDWFDVGKTYLNIGTFTDFKTAHKWLSLVHIGRSIGIDSFKDKISEYNSLYDDSMHRIKIKIQASQENLAVSESKIGVYFGK